jgi:hypothetical protein
MGAVGMFMGNAKGFREGVSVSDDADNVLSDMIT